MESNLEATAIIKRNGFSREAALTVATGPATGAFEFTDDSGNSVTIVCHDRYCASSVNNAAFSNFLSTAGGTGAVPTRWSCVSVDGDAYCANDRRDAVFKFDGTNDTHPSEIPAGSLLAMTEDRLVVSDTAANPNRVAYSKSADYQEFTVGANQVDPWTDDIGSPGDRNTGLFYDRGRLYIFKRTSIASCLLGDQYSTRCTVISNNIGTQDQNSIVSAPDGVYFTSQDGAYWLLNESGLELISQKIRNTVKNRAVGSSRSNTQTTQTDWEAGSDSPDGSFNAATTAGSIFASSVTFVDTSSTNFAAGTQSQTSTSTAGSLILDNIFVNHNFEQATMNNWTSTAGWTVTASGASCYGSRATKGSASTSVSQTGIFEVLNASDDSAIYKETKTLSDITGACTEYSIRTATQNSVDNFKFRVTDHVGRTLTSPSFAKVDTVIYSFALASNTGVGPQTYSVSFDLPQAFYVRSGTFTSQAFDTAFSAPTWGVFKATRTIPTSSTLTFATQVATSSSGSWDAATTAATDGRITSAQKRYVRYQAYYGSFASSITATANDIELAATTTGQYRTQCIQPGSGITAWGIFSCAQTNAGAGGQTFYSTSAASCAALPTTLPNAWTAETNNATLTISTNVAMYLGWQSLMGSTTDQSQVDACTIYWNNGTSAQPVWGVYDSINNAIYWTATTTGASSGQGDRVHKYDINLGYFYPFDLRATALLFNNNSVYFGGSTGGTWNRYGQSGVTSDNGTSINAYWKSKDFYGTSPFLESTYKNVSIVAKNQITGNMSVTLTTSDNNSTAYTVSLATTSGVNYVRSNRALPMKSPYNFINVKFGNNSSVPFEILGLKIDFFSQPWRAINP